jgi:hypothetical protein
MAVETVDDDELELVLDVLAVVVVMNVRGDDVMDGVAMCRRDALFEARDAQQDSAATSGPRRSGFDPTQPLVKECRFFSIHWKSPGS